MQGHARLEELHRGAPYCELHGAFGDELDQLARTVRELRRRALDIRTTPVRRLLERLPRVVQRPGARARQARAGRARRRGGRGRPRACSTTSTTRSCTWCATRSTTGSRREAERVAAGKDPVGTLRMRASRVAGRLQLRLDEDGRGIDVEKVRRRAIERGLLLEMVAEDLPAERIREFIFEPGISTTRRGQRHLRPRRRAGRGEAPGRGARRHDRRRRARPARARRSCSTCRRWSRCSACWCCRSAASASRCRSRASRRCCRAEEAAVERAGRRRVLHVQGRAAAAGRPRPAASACRARRASGRLRGGARGARLQARPARRARGRRPRSVRARDARAARASSRRLGGVAILRDGAPVFLLEIGSLVENFR